MNKIDDTRTGYLLIGAGGHARVVSSILEALGENIVAVFDMNKSIKSLDGIQNLVTYSPNLFPESKIIIAIGDSKKREEIVSKIKHKFGVVIHPSAIVDRLVKIGEGSQVIHGVIINRGTNIGSHCLINTSSSIDHDCEIGDFVHIAPNAVICGSVTIGNGTLVGAGSCILPNLKIGKNVTIAAGSVVTKNIPDNSLVKGIPGIIM